MTDWLAETTNRYVCAEKHETHRTFLTSESVNNRDDLVCDLCGRPAPYVGFVPRELNMVTRVTFEQNGRKAVRITDGNGTVQHISQTKLRYQETGIVDHQYTPAFKEHLKKNDDKLSHLIGTDTNRRMAKAVRHKGAEE